MRELQRILATYDALKREGGSAVLSTVVRVAGSTYRRAGARMLIPERGDPVGLISGGCLEPDVALRGREVLTSGEPKLVRYDTRSDDDLVWGLGLGCNGLVELLLERVPPEREPDPLEVLRQSVLERHSAVLATVFAVPGEAHVAVGDRIALRDDGSQSGEFANSELAANVMRDGLAALGSGSAPVAAYETDEGRFEVLIESLEPPLPLAVIGAGPDALPVTRLAAELGFDVTVVDRRPAYADASRFPDAARVLDCEPSDLLDRVSIGPRSAVLVMTHSYLQDLEYLRELLPSRACYVGILGPRQRTERLLKELAEQGVEPNAEQRARLYAPVGLDIGADNPEEIALAILAEIRAVQNGKRGGSLRDREGPIHPPHR
jgi:xanthine/CO dehydrogenase XdhC/CoxF family maturation factor